MYLSLQNSARGDHVTPFWPMRCRWSCWVGSWISFQEVCLHGENTFSLLTALLFLLVWNRWDGCNSGSHMEPWGYLEEGSHAWKVAEQRHRAWTPADIVAPTHRHLTTCLQICFTWENEPLISLSPFIQISVPAAKCDSWQTTSRVGTASLPPFHISNFHCHSSIFPSLRHRPCPQVAQCSTGKTDLQNWYKGHIAKKMYKGHENPKPKV